ncbi:MAG: 3-oxoacyl-ACP reductase family protein [Cyanobacteriota bacterium]|nr:3-oxoacyl-ACP reductase family protein [Cyanobacteriota bacterium]
MKTLQGKTAIVTGSSKGIGAAIAQKLAAEGAHVIINYARSSGAAEQVVAQIEARGGQATMVQADMSSPSGVETLFAQADRILDGRLDILVNNAGFFPLGTLEESTPEDFEKIVNLNVRGVFLAARAAISRMEEGGRIINIGSIFGERMPLPGIGLYTMSKFAVAGFTRAWSRDLGPRKITVNTVQPGPIDTELNPAEGEFAEQIIPYTALGRYGQPQEVAALVAFLASEAAGYITGTSLTVDGGVNA